MIFFLLLCLTGAWAKRLPPPALKPLLSNGMSYTIDVQEDQKIFAVSLVAKTHRQQVEQWRAPLYRIILKPDLERDVQHVWVKSLTLEGKSIVAVNERGHRYTVDLASGQSPRAYFISGFDDVLRQAENTGLIAAGLKLFDPDLTFAGMPELYTLLTYDEENPRFSVVSAIGTWFNRRITDFLNDSRYPTYELRLRSWLTEFSIERFKMQQVSQVVLSKPNRRFIVVFDNSDASLQLAQRMYAEYPDTIQTVYLREVEKKDHPTGTIPFHTAFDIAVSEVQNRRLTEKEAIVIGHALLEEQDAEKVIPSYAYCPKEYAPCSSQQGDLVKICGLVEERVRGICAKR